VVKALRGMAAGHNDLKLKNTPEHRAFERVLWAADEDPDRGGTQDETSPHIYMRCGEVMNYLADLVEAPGVVEFGWGYEYDVSGDTFVFFTIVANGVIVVEDCPAPAKQSEVK